MEGGGGEKILAAGGDHAIECGVHVRIKISQSRDKSVVKAVMDYCILAVFAKTYNKCYMCKKGKQDCKAGIKKENSRKWQG